MATLPRCPDCGKAARTTWDDGSPICGPCADARMALVMRDALAILTLEDLAERVRARDVTRDAAWAAKGAKVVA